MARKKKGIKKVESVKKDKISFDSIRKTKHIYGVQARKLLEDRGCMTCKKGGFIYTGTYVKGDRIFIEVVCNTCKTVSKVLMPELSVEDI